MQYWNGKPREESLVDKLEGHCVLQNVPGNWWPQQSYWEGICFAAYFGRIGSPPIHHRDSNPPKESSVTKLPNHMVQYMPSPQCSRIKASEVHVGCLSITLRQWCLYLCREVVQRQGLYVRFKLTFNQLARIIHKLVIGVSWPLLSVV